ncbi:hypothetical protein PS662_03427 [Pseudomonas fluorescens]|uniref:Uncharacterized protein n=1 Tax=Pseudomonas fluorescens TaxID=294 RepID=A0A5E6UB61_PSEFL|nr:hypothetical protein PS662_03427 [Pseudomonas fluorescens]
MNRPRIPDPTQIPVGAGLPAMDVNDDAYRMIERVACESIASKLAPTVDRAV